MLRKAVAGFWPRGLDRRPLSAFDRKGWRERRSGAGKSFGYVLSSAAAAATGLYFIYGESKKLLAVDAETVAGETFRPAGARKAGLREYRMADVRKHDTDKARIWVTFNNGVYDITDFVPKHPGAKNVLMAAGGSLEPFWNFYAVHLKNQHVHDWLESYRIGNLHPDDVAENAEQAAGHDPYLEEPKRNAGLVVNSRKPFNAETPLGVLAEHFYTPNEWFYVRNHLPTPDISGRDYELELCLEDKTLATLSLDDLKTGYERVEVTAAIQCGGNRRAEMAGVRPIKGLPWKGGAIGNARWAGARLSDVVGSRDMAGVEHVQFEGYDEGSDGSPYGASIPVGLMADTILAYEMNGEELPRDHGHPVRIVVPGVVGARNVKWVRRIVLSSEESPSHWQRSDYKGFSPSVDWSNVDFASSPAIQAMPITSVVCDSMVADGKVHLKGYAWAGGGNRVIRVDLTADGGDTWHEAALEQERSVEPKHYGWSIFRARLPVPAGSKRGSEIEVWSKAVDSNYNSQPESFKNIWNLRGLNSNAYHRIKVKV